LANEASILDIVKDWAKAEESANVENLSRLLADNFLGIGPKGFVSNKQQWIERSKAL
jgi:hypothetical protein